MHTRCTVLRTILDSQKHLSVSIATKTFQGYLACSTWPYILANSFLFARFSNKTFTIQKATAAKTRK